MDDRREIVKRRFGSAHDKPCKQPTTITCALWRCQYANECQHPNETKKCAGIWADTSEQSEIMQCKN